MHWESYNTAYVQSADAESLVGSMLEELYEYYEEKGEILKEFMPTSLCAGTLSR